MVSTLVLIIALNRGLVHTFFIPLIVIIIIPLVTFTSPFNKTTIQNLLILLPFAFNYKIHKQFLSYGGIVVLFYVLFYLFFTNSALSGLKNYNMNTVLPFFDSVDAAFFFLLTHLIFIKIKRSTDSLSFFVYFGLVLSAIGVLLSGNRFSLIILVAIWLLSSQIKFVFLLFVIVVISKDWIVDEVIRPYLPLKLVTMLLDKSLLDLLTADSSFLVRIRNVSRIFENADWLNLFFGFGSEIGWRQLLSDFRNKSLDNSLFVYLFTYGYLGVYIYIWLLRRIYILAGFLFAFVFFTFSMMQDISGNFLYMSSLLIHIVILKNLNFDDRQEFI